MKINNIPLTAAELANLWSSYMSNSMGVCVLKYFSAKAEDPEAKKVIDSALQGAETNLSELRDIIKLENICMPIGFSDEDVNVHAPRLFSDMFVLQYIKQMANMGMISYSAGMYISSRMDIRDLFNRFIIASADLDQYATQAMLLKGAYVRPPHIDPPKQIDFVKEQNFLFGWLGKQRPLTALEITNLFINIFLNSLGKAVMIGFSQVAQSKDVKKYFIRGKHIATKHIDVFYSILNDEEISIPGTWESHVSPSTISPFSDKLMMFHTTALTALGIGNYGIAISTSPRRDIATHYSRLVSEAALYAEDGANIMIKNGWLEEPPKSADRESLINT